MKGLFSCVLVLIAACGPAPQVVTQPAAAGERQTSLRPVSALPFDFMWRQRVDAHWPTGDQAFEAVLQKQQGELTLLGLSPMGLPGFVLTLRADGSLRIENRMGQPLPFEPAYIMADVQRVFYPWLGPVPPAFDGERSGVVGDQQVRELYEHGALRERTFTPIGAEGDQVYVRYGDRAKGADAPHKVRLENATRRYALDIETFSQERL